MSFRRRPSLSGTTHGSSGRSSVEPDHPPGVDLAQLRLLLISARGLPCFQASGCALLECRGLDLYRTGTDRQQSAVQQNRQYGTF